MANYFYLTLDTTPPIAEINLPAYVFDELVFTITSNEELDTWYECYIIDSEDVRHDLNIQHNGDFFSATVNISTYPDGNLMVYARVRDLVHNTTHEINALTVKYKNNFLKIRNIELQTLNKITDIELQTLNKVTDIELQELNKIDMSIIESW